MEQMLIFSSLPAAVWGKQIEQQHTSGSAAELTQCRPSRRIIFYIYSGLFFSADIRLAIYFLATQFSAEIRLKFGWNVNI